MARATFTRTVLGGTLARARASPAPVLALICAVAGVVGAAGVLPGPWRVVATATFLSVAPGLAVVSAIGIRDRAAVLTLVPAASLALSGLFSSAAIHLGFPFPSVPITLLAVVTAATACFALARDHERPHLRSVPSRRVAGARPAEELVAPRPPTEVDRRSSLRYGTDSEPGIRRESAGGGTRHVLPDGSAVRDPATLRRIEALAVPASWEEVWISLDPDSHVQATGHDQSQKARKRTLFHRAWPSVRDTDWFSGAIVTGTLMPRLRKRLATDLRATRPSTDLFCAWIIDALVEPLTHADPPAVADSTGPDARLAALAWRAPVVVDLSDANDRKTFPMMPGDPRLRTIAAQCTALPGQPLLGWWAEGGIDHSIRSDTIARYVRRATGRDLGVEHIRSWVATVLLVTTFTGRDPAGRTHDHDRDGCMAWVAMAIGQDTDRVAAHYVHPAARAAHDTGRVLDLARLPPERGRGRAERAVLALLEQSSRDAGEP